MQRNLAYAQEMVGDIELAQGQAHEALASYTTSLNSLRRLAESDPGNADWQRDLAVIYAHIGDAQVGEAPAKASRSYSTGLAILSRLIEADPDNIRLQSVLAYVDWRMANAELTVDRISEAQELYTKSRDIRQRVNDPLNQFFFAMDETGIGDAQFKLGEVQLALNSYSAGQVDLQRISETDAENAIWRHALAVTYSKLTFAYEAEHEFVKAQAAASAGREILSRLVDAHPDLLQWSNELKSIDARIVALGRN